MKGVMNRSNEYLLSILYKTVSANEVTKGEYEYNQSLNRYAIGGQSAGPVGQRQRRAVCSNFHSIKAGKLNLLSAVTVPAA